MQRNVVVSSLFWKLVEKTSTQVIQLIVTIVLARLLLPADYGMLAMVTVFITIMNAFVEGGLGTAIIQSKSLDDVDCNSVFFLNIVLSVTLYTMVHLISPWIAHLYGSSEIIIILRVYAIMIIVSAFSVVQSALLYRRMMFKLFFKKTILSLILSGITGMTMAYFGFGVWALVVQQIMNKLTLCFMLWNTVKWFPKFKISLKRLWGLLKFSVNVLINNLLETVYNQLRCFIIGIKFTSADIAYYNKGEQFPAMVATSTDFALQGVMLSAYSKGQDDYTHVKSMLRRTIKAGCFILMPVMAGFAASAEPMVKLLLSDRWLPCVPYMRIICIIYAFQTIRTSNMHAVYGIGKSRTVLKINVISKLIGIAILTAAAQISVMAIAVGAALSSLIMTVIYAIPGAKYFGYTLGEQIGDIFSSVMLSTMMFGCIYAINFLPLGTISKLLLQLICGMAVYFGLSRLFKVESYFYLRDMAKEFILKRLIKKRTKKGQSE